VFYRPILKVEMVMNGKVVAVIEGDGRQRELTLPFKTKMTEVLDRRAGKSVSYAGEPEIWAHANRSMFSERQAGLCQARPRRLCASVGQEVDYYKTGALQFEKESQREELMRLRRRRCEVWESTTALAGEVGKLGDRDWNGFRFRRRRRGGQT